MNHYLKILTCLLLVFFTMGSVHAQSEGMGKKQEPLIFGFLPILSTQKLVARFGPLVDYLSEQLDREIRLETAPNYTEFVKRTNNEKRYDLLFTAPHFYYLAEREAGYRVIVRVDAPDMHAIIVAPKDSGMTSIQDLRNRSLSTVDPISLATVLVRTKLQETGIDPDREITLVATPTHNASLLTALKKGTDAASLMLTPYNRARPEVKERMLIIARTQGTPHMPIAAAPWLSETVVDIIKKSMLDLNETQQGKALLKHLSWPGFTTAAPQDYDQLEWVVQEIKLQ